MTATHWARFGRALLYAAHSGFPWVGGGTPDGMSLQLRRALRRSVVGLWPRPIRLPAQILMTLLWPLESLRDAMVFTFQMNRPALGGRSRIGVALRAWIAALRYNLPPVDYLCYRLFEPGRPGPGCWLHSADASRHFTALAAPEVRTLAADKLRFSELAQSVGVAAMPILAVYARGAALRPFPDQGPPAQNLLVKPRHGSGSRGHTEWLWDGARHVAQGRAIEQDLGTWLLHASKSTDLLVQPLAAAPSVFGPVIASRPPVASVVTVEWPDRRREVATAVIGIPMREGAIETGISRPVDLASSWLMPVQPGWIAPAWDEPRDREDFATFIIPGWRDILADIDRVHAVLPGPAPVLKWDILFTSDGPKLLETNTGTGIYLLQSMTLRPITETPLGAVLEAWARWRS